MCDVIQWVITRRAAEKALQNFPELFSEYQKSQFIEGNRNPVYNRLQAVAEDSGKCRSLNSIDILVLPIKTDVGQKKVTYYNKEDIAFTTVVGNFDNQKLVTNIFSLKAKLKSIENDRFQRSCSKSNPRRAIKHGYDEKIFRKRHGG